MQAGVGALHLLGTVALVLGFLVLCAGRGAAARRLLAGQAAAVGLGAAALALDQPSPLLAGAALVVIIGGGGLALRLAAPDIAPAPLAPALGAGLVAVAILAVPEIAGMPREGLGIGIGTALLGAVAATRAGRETAGLLGFANGIALTALMAGDAPVALAATLLALLAAALAQLLGRPGQAA